MATKKQKQELIDTLKFTPRTYRIMLQGYGGECYAGRVDRKIYEYFREQKIDIAEYASSWDGFDDMPQEMKPFEPGAPFECDNLFHASGMEMSDLNEVEVFDENDNVIWSCAAGFSELEDAGVTVECGGGEDLDDLELGEVVFWGGQGEKGCFFDGEIYLKAPFDPKKLTVYYENCDGWYIVNTVEYDGEYIETDGYSTTGKWGDAKWRLGGDEEPYEDIVSVEDREDEGLEWTPVIEETKADFECVQCEWKGLVDEVVFNDLDQMTCPECGESVEAVDDQPESACTSEFDPAAELEEIFQEHMLTEWFDSNTKPARPGEYECEFKVVTWPWPAVRRCTWTGRTWKDANGEKAKGEFRWRGVREEFAHD